MESYQDNLIYQLDTLHRVYLLRYPYQQTHLRLAQQIVDHRHQTIIHTLQMLPLRIHQFQFTDFTIICPQTACQEQ